jgi:DNA-binding NtrC family response regulator
MERMSNATDPATDAPPLNIVALDDDADFREYLQGLLEAEGHAVRTVGTPEALYATCAEDQPEIILLDIKMGNHSGEEILAEIRKRWPRQCVIVVTGYPSLDSMRQTFMQDVFDYITKPFGVEDIRRAIAQAAETFGLGQRPQDRLRAELGRQIRLARTERGWTLRELSNASAVSVSQLSSIERGTHLPSIESLVAIASALRCSPSDWLAGAGF